MTTRAAAEFIADTVILASLSFTAVCVAVVWFLRNPETRLARWFDGIDPAGATA